MSECNIQKARKFVLLFSDEFHNETTVAEYVMRGTLLVLVPEYVRWMTGFRSVCIHLVLPSAAIGSGIMRIR